MFSSIIFVLRPFVLFAIFLLLTLSISRYGLAIWNIDRFHDIKSLLALSLNGLRIDLSLLGYLLILPALLHPWLIASKLQVLWLKALKIWFFVVLVSVLFFELATPAFIIEYGFRPNRLFIEYLAYPDEVMKMLFNGHLATITIVFSSLIILSLGIWRTLDKLVLTCKNKLQLNIPSSLVSFLALILVLFLCARGTVGHRPINPSLVYFSTDPLINSLTLNSLYCVAHAYKQFGDEKNASKLYGKMENQQIIKLVQQETLLEPVKFISSSQPSLAIRKPLYQGKPKNLVIILEESLGAQYVSSLGGLAITPEIDKLNAQGWAFNHLYATGTRSVRGIEAVITGFTPTPSRAVVKLDKSQQNFFTIASLLKNNNYTTQFIYGGESHFDNMKSFFLGNGFTDIVDFKDILDPKFVASWGASDEDLFNQANIELNKLHQSNKPFFSFIFTSSNHDPFEIPDGVVTPIKYTEQQLATYDSKELLRHKAIQYADYALGKFINKAKIQDYWQDTIFLVVADHDARAMGNALVPINNFHIPGVILNSGIETKVENRVVSQIDLAPTLLSLMGVTNQSPMLGHDLNDPNASGRAMMQYADNFAYMQGQEVTILQPQKPALNFQYDHISKVLKPISLNLNLSNIALAHVLWGSLAYENEWFKAAEAKRK
ncbi:LTA synthase family protein [Paraglaciecola aquimarina]|uniref:LTA synthase family protein n=1 Tax=Paraglaciecola algarum TaxID=3050085 RepID=A0ABS9DA28_9ALTE|nr:LTA synthase family protein [Paraglaciecola sp. G1-23]MCF2948639.1 LTA synthase family protein [Paraglaciecola sp. G1-23]